MDQMSSAGIHDIVVSTSPKFHALMEAFVLNYCAERDRTSTQRSVSIRTVSIAAHAFGPVPAIFEVFRQLGLDRPVLLCLGDLFYPYNPFSSVVDKRAQQLSYLTVCEYSEHATGAVYVADDKVTSISYVKPTEDFAAKFPIYCRWTGIAILDPLVAGVIDNLSRREFGNQFFHSPIEDLLQDLVLRGCAFSTISSGNFINVNEISDLLRCQEPIAP
jgi:NDP-sugar pyrophosphorylase family protein